MAKRKMTNNDLQSTTQKTKDRATRTPLKVGLNTDAPEGQTVPVSTSVTGRVKEKHHEHHLIWKSCCTPVCVNKYK